MKTTNSDGCRVLLKWLKEKTFWYRRP